MRGSPALLTFIVSLALLVVPGSTVSAHSDELPAAAFPTGTFVADFSNPDRYVEFAEDGSCRWVALDGYWERTCTYAVSGDLFTETTFDWPDGPQVPATYLWDWDGSLLTLELWGDELQQSRYGTYAIHPLRLVEDGVVVYVAATRASPGMMVAPTRRFLPSADVPPDAIADMSDYRGWAAAVPIERGSPITPAMLEPPAE